VPGRSTEPLTLAAFAFLSREFRFTESRELRLPQNGGRLMVRAEVEKEIARIDAKMPRLTKQRDLLLHTFPTSMWTSQKNVHPLAFSAFWLDSRACGRASSAQVRSPDSVLGNEME
jgi:hypothetical protein